MKASTTAIVSAPATAAESTARRSILAPIVGRLLSDKTLRRTVGSVFDQCVVSGTSFITSVVIGRNCSQQELGLYSLGLSLLLFARGIQADTITAPYTIYCSRRKGDELALYAGSSFVHQAALSALTLVGLLFLFVAVSFGYGPAGLAPTVWVLLGVAPCLLLREHIRGFAFAHLNLGTAILIDVVVAALQLGSLLALARFDLLSAESVYLVSGLACSLACLGWFWARHQPLRINFTHCIADWRHNWSFAKWALASQLTGRATSYLMPWFVALIHGEAATGLLAACVTLVNLSGTFVTGVSNYLTPKAAHAYSNEGVDALCRVLWKAAVLFTVSVGACCIATLFVGDWIALLVYGERYSGAGLIITVLGLGMLANSLGITVGNGLWALEHPQANFTADVWTLVVTLAAVALLIVPLGVLGAALAMFLGTLTGAAVRSVTFLNLVQSVRRDHPAA